MIGGDEPVVIAGSGWCRLPNLMRGYNVAANADGSAIFFNGTATVVADIDYRTCRCKSVAARKVSPRYVVDIKPFGKGWLAVMGSTKGESFVVMLDRRGHVMYSYQIPPGPARYDLMRADEGILIAGNGNPIFGYDGHSLRRLETPVHSLAVEGSSLLKPMVLVGDEIVRVTFRETVPGHAVRGVWVGAGTFIVDRRAYLIALTACVVGVIALVLMGGHALMSRAKRVYRERKLNQGSERNDT